MIKEHIKNQPTLYKITREVKYNVIRPVHLSLYTAYRELAIKILPLSSHDKVLKSLNGKFKGKTAFIVGNGPSLKAHDLEMIKKAGGYCFASNRIHLIFNETEWRPDFYVAVDGALIGDQTHTLETVLQENISYYFLAPDVYDHMDATLIKTNNVVRFHKKRNNLLKCVSEFSDDAIKYLVDGFTTTYPALQLAYYLGFSKIALIGVDCSYSNIINKDGTVTRLNNALQYFSKEYDTAKGNSANVIGMQEAYACANLFFKSKGVPCFNATRGGMLEAFPRKSLEELCEEML